MMGIKIMNNNELENDKYINVISETGNGSLDSPFIIDDSEGLGKLLAGEIISEGKYFIVTHDIELKTQPTYNIEFNGVLNGQGHTISGIKLLVKAEGKDIRIGLFNSIGKKGLVCNLNVELVRFSVTVNQLNITAGTICGENYGIIINCNVTSKDNSWWANINVKDEIIVPKIYCGLLAGNNYGYIYNSFSTGEVISNIFSQLNLEEAYITAGGCIGHNQGNVHNIYTSSNLAVIYDDKPLKTNFYNVGGTIGISENSNINYGYWNIDKKQEIGKREQKIEKDKIPEIKNNIPIENKLGIGNRPDTKKGGKMDSESGAEAKTTAIKENEMKLESFTKKLNSNMFPFPLYFKQDSDFQFIYCWEYNKGRLPTLNARYTSDFPDWGSKSNPFKITDKHILTIFSFAVQCGLSFKEKYIRLENDIKLTELWNPIGYISDLTENVFEGIFLGNGKTISGIQIDTDCRCAGFFTKIGTDGMVKDLNLEFNSCGITSCNAEYIGGLAGICNGYVENCNISAKDDNLKMSINSNKKFSIKLGGLIGECNKKVSQCAIKTNINIDTKELSELYAGGSIGFLKGGVEKCSIIGDIVCKYKGAEGQYLNSVYFGGLLGYALNSDIKASYSRGSYIYSDYQVTDSANIGAFVGMFTSSKGNTIKNCYSCSDITKSTTGLQCLINKDKVLGVIHCGGLFGRLWTNSVINNCYVSQNIKVITFENIDSTGALFGRVDDAEGCQYNYVYWNSNITIEDKSLVLGVGNDMETYKNGKHDDPEGGENKTTSYNDMMLSKFVTKLNEHCDSTDSKVWALDKEKINYGLPILSPINKKF